MGWRNERPNEAFVRAALQDTRLAEVRWVPETGSTNDDLAAAAVRGEGEQVLITDLQTAGRGRRNRVWDAPAGSGVLMSVLLRGVDTQDGFWAVGAVALAACQTIDSLAVSACTLKWPNDVLLGDDQKKVAGVLAQIAGDAVIVGIGINVNWPDDVPAAMAERGTAINQHVGNRQLGNRHVGNRQLGNRHLGNRHLGNRQLGNRHLGAEHLNADGEVDRPALAADILLRAIGHLQRDVDELQSIWKEHSSTIGQLVRIERKGGDIVGTATDIGRNGALQIRDESGDSWHQVGDVVHLRPAN